MKRGNKYVYDHKTGTFSMNVKTLVDLMDVETRARLEKRLAKYESVPYDVEGVVV